MKFPKPPRNLESLTPDERVAHQAQLYLFHKANVRFVRRYLFFTLVMVPVEFILFNLYPGWWTALTCPLAVAVAALGFPRNFKSHVADRDAPEVDTVWLGPVPWPMFPGRLGHACATLRVDEQGNVEIKIEDDNA